MTSTSMTANNMTPIPEHAQYQHLRLSKRVRDTEEAHIEEVLGKYACISPRPANLAQGVARWNPPEAALRLVQGPGKQRSESLGCSDDNGYGPALGLPALRRALSRKVQEENGVNMAGQEVMRSNDR